jgi:hypothetical protein
MILDSEQQRSALLEMFRSINFPGHALDQVYALKQAIVNASVAVQPEPSGAGVTRGGKLSPEALAETATGSGVS